MATKCYDCLEIVIFMHLLELTLPTLAENLACDEALLLQAEDGRQRELLRFWEWGDKAVVLGAGCPLADDVRERACLDDKVPILRRSSGGGTVLLAKGCLCYSLILGYDRLPILRGINSSYRYILGRVATALRGLLPSIVQAGTSDLASEGMKFSGNSQQRKRRFLLHHGTLLYRFDLPQVSRYLRAPARQPAYRQAREHSEFLINLATSADDLRLRMANAWNAHEGITDWPREECGRLVLEKYSQEQWLRRR